MSLLRALVITLLVAAQTALAADRLVFAFFRKNGEDGLYLAESADGLAWNPLNNDQPLLKPMVGESKLMRDPSIVRGPDGTFHMVWTTSWTGKTIGYASSKDLRTWSPQRAIEVMGHEPGVHNCWAPELFYDAPKREFLIVWASTIAGRFPETLGTAERELNHRLYATRTRDFVTFTPTKLFYDPGFLVIDGAIFRHRGEYVMTVKNETLKPPAKHVYVTRAKSLDGPWSKPGPSITGVEWAEGPTPIEIGGQWYVWFDRYRKHSYGVIRSRDLEHWEDLSAQLKLPAGIRHGTVFRAPEKVVAGLRR